MLRAPSRSSRGEPVFEFLNHIPDPTYRIIWLFMADHWRDFDVHYAKTIELKMIAKWGLMKWESLTCHCNFEKACSWLQMMCLVWTLDKTFEGFEKCPSVCAGNIFGLLTCWPLFFRPHAEANKSSFSSEQFSFDILNLNMNRLIQVSRSQDWCLKRCSGKDSFRLLTIAKESSGLFVIWNAY